MTGDSEDEGITTVGADSDKKISFKDLVCRTHFKNLHGIRADVTIGALPGRSVAISIPVENLKKKRNFY